MKKLLFILLLFIPLNIFALTYPKLHYDKAILYDMTDDKILYEVKKSEKADIASLTKIMTTIVAIENIDDLNYSIKYTQEMANNVRFDASVAGLKIGDQITYKDLLYASILPSGADATSALAIKTSGSISAFVEKMNELAQEIGMNNTHFENVTGLDEIGHYSTVEDLLILLKYSLNNKIFKEVYTTKTYTLSNNLFIRSTLFSAKTTKDTSRILGSKTGFTEKAGRCISAYFISNNHEFLLITLKAPADNNFYHILDALDLIEFLDHNYNEQSLIKENQIIKEIKVKNSKIETYDLTSSKNITKFLPNDYDPKKVKIEYSGLEELSFKNKKNSKIGTITYLYDEEKLTTEEFYLKEEIELDLFKTIYSYRLQLTIIFTIVIFIVIVFLNMKKRLLK